MENIIMKKKLSTFLTEKGQLRNLPSEVLLELLHCWEQWTGKQKDFYKSIGFTHRQIAGLIGKAKKLKREGHGVSEEFKEILVEGLSEKTDRKVQNIPIILRWDKTKSIKFYNIDHLVDFIKKVS